MTTLVVGATGLLGAEICRRFAADRKPARALVRTSSNPETVSRLAAAGVEIAQGDLKDRASLTRACAGAKTVISTATATRPRQEGDSFQSVDTDGQLGLVDTAAAAGVEHFIFVSFPRIDLEFAFQDAKRAVEGTLRRSGMVFTILQPATFMEVWLSPALGFDVVNGQVRVLGSGENKNSYISYVDVARAAVAALDAPAARNRSVMLSGPDTLTPNDVIRMAEELAGRRFVVEHVPETMLEAQYAVAPDPLAKSFSALMLSSARGMVVEDEGASVLQVRATRTVRDHLRMLLGIRD